MCSSLGNKYDFFNIGLFFTPEVFILCQKVWGARELGANNFDITILSKGQQLYLKQTPLQPENKN